MILRSPSLIRAKRRCREKNLKSERLYSKEDENFMVTYGDGVSDINIKELVKFHKKQGTIGTVTGVHPRSKYGLLATDKNKIITSFIEKPVLKEWVNGGFMVFKRGFFDFLKKGEMEHQALKRLVIRDSFLYISMTIFGTLWIHIRM